MEDYQNHVYFFSLEEFNVKKALSHWYVNIMTIL